MNPHYPHQQLLQYPPMYHQLQQQHPYFYPQPAPQLPPPVQDDIFKFRFATNQLGLLVKGAEIILSHIYPWVDPQLRAQINEWYCRKEECVACIAGTDNQGSTTENASESGQLEAETQSSASTCSLVSQGLQIQQDDEAEDSDASPPSSDKDLSEEIDSDEDIDEDSDGSNTDALIDHYQTKFREILDEKIADTEAFFDHYKCVINSITSQQLSEIPEDLFDEKAMKKSAEPDEEGEEDRQSIGSENYNCFAKIPSRFSALPPRSKSDGEIYYRPCPRRPKKSVSVWDTVYDMSPVQKIDKCLTELQQIMNTSAGKEIEGVENILAVPEEIQKSVVKLILSARSALQSSLPQELENSTSNVLFPIVEVLTGKLGSLNSSGKHVESQTDDFTFVDPRISMQSTEEPEIARLEVSNLRDARMSLVVQRKDFADKLKQAGQEDSSKEEERRLYEFEEAIEAIDTAIEFKNEIILGHKCVLSSQSAPGHTEADLVTRLTSLSMLDLQRLLCKYFSKVVELRFSSTKLEKTLEKLEADREKLTRRLASDQRYIRKMDEGRENQITQFLSLSKTDPNAAVVSHLRKLEQDLIKAERKQYDLQRSLTELLVRHGYLLNGTDYDVMQVVRMLGIDTVQMGLNWKDDKTDERERRKRNLRDNRRQPTGLIPSKLASALEAMPPGQGLSRRMKEASSQRRNAQSSSSHHPPQPLVDLIRKGHSSRHPEQTHELSPRKAHSYCLSDQVQDLSPRKGHSSRHHEPAPEPAGTEVRRNKKKLIIQSSQPSSSHHHHNHH